MHRMFHSNSVLNVTSEDENTPNPTSPREDAKWNLVNLTKRLQEAETYLSASRSYLDASVASLENLKKYMCFSEVDIRTATDCVAETEKKLEAIHLELQSLYHNIVCEDSCYGSQYDESERNANKIPTTVAIPSPVLEAMSRCAHGPIDLNAYAMKCYKYKKSTFVMLHPKQHMQVRREIDERRDTAGDFRSRQMKIVEDFPTVKMSSGNCVRLQEPVNVDQIYEGGLEWEDTLEQNPDFSMDASMKDLNLNKKRSGTANEVLNTDHWRLPVGTKHAVPIRTVGRKIPANSRTNAASQNDWNFEDCRSSISNLPMKSVSYEEDSNLKKCSSFGSTNQPESKQKGCNFRRVVRLLENEASRRQLSKQQTEKKSVKYSSKRGLFYEAKERDVAEGDTSGNMLQEVFDPESTGTFSKTHSSNLFLAKRQERRLKEMCEQSTQDSAESDEILVKRNRPKPHKKTGVYPAPLTKGTAFKDGGRNDQSLNPEESSNQYFEISLPADSVAMSPKKSRRTADGYIENLIQTFENDERLKNEITNETAFPASGCASYCLQGNESANKSRTPTPRRHETVSEFIQRKNTKDKVSKKNSMTVINNSSRKPFLHEKRKNDLSDRENNLDNGSINSLSPRFSLDNDMKNKNFAILPLYTVSDNPESFNSSIELGSSLNRPNAFRNASTSCNTVLRPDIEEQNRHLFNQKETIRSSLPVKTRVKETKNPCTINSYSNDSPPKQPGDGNSCVVHHRNLDSVFQEATKASKSSSEPNEKPFDPDGKDALDLQYELRDSCSSQNRSETVFAGPECIETSDLLPGSSFVPEQENYESLNYKSFSSEVNGSKQFHASTNFSRDTHPNDFSNPSHLPLSERDSPRALSGISSNSFNLQRETRLSDREDSQEACASISNPFSSYEWSPRSRSPEISDSKNCFPENLL